MSGGLEYSDKYKEKSGKSRNFFKNVREARNESSKQDFNQGVTKK